MSSKFGSQTDLDILKRVTSPNPKPEVVLRRRGCRLENRPHRRCITISGFGLGDVALLRMPKSISKPNFVGITQSTAARDITTFGLKKTSVRHVGILFPVSISTT